MIVERLVVRPLYTRPLDAILATWGLGIIIGQLITLAFGREVQFVAKPDHRRDRPCSATSYSQYRLILVLVAVVLAVRDGRCVLNGTRLGPATPAR